MGASFGANDPKSLNVELNIVPFIDLMSCLTAFLLVTAVWVNLSALENEPVGRTAGTIDQEVPRLSILLDHDEILVTASPSGEARRVGAFDWTRLEDTLREFKTAGDLPQVEVAAVSTGTEPIAYGQLITAMDVAVKVGYPRVGVTDPASLGY